MAASSVSTDELFEKLRPALGLEKHNVRRLVMDLDSRNPTPIFYIELYGDDQILEIDWLSLTGTDIHFADSEA